MTTYHAIVPAGGRIDPNFAQVVGTSSKALIRFDGETVLHRIVRSLRDTGRVDRIVVVGGEEVRASVDVETIAEVGSGPENILAGLSHLLASPQPPDKVLIVTADLPFIEAGQITGFLDLCPPEMEVCVPIVRKADYQARFPNSTSTYVPLADDYWTMGGTFLVGTEAFQRSMPRIEAVFKNRKSVVGMAMLLGPAFLWKLKRRTLTVPDIEQKIRAMLGVKGTAIRDVAPELAFDIDALDDYEYALELKK